MRIESEIKLCPTKTQKNEKLITKLTKRLIEKNAESGAGNIITITKKRNQPVRKLKELVKCQQY
jgi:hypothetical protein